MLILPWSSNQLYVSQNPGVFTRVRSGLRQHSSGIRSRHVLTN